MDNLRKSHNSVDESSSSKSIIGGRDDGKFDVATDDNCEPVAKRSKFSDLVVNLESFVDDMRDNEQQQTNGSDGDRDLNKVKVELKKQKGSGIIFSFKPINFEEEREYLKKAFAKNFYNDQKKRELFDALGRIICREYINQLNNCPDDSDRFHEHKALLSEIINICCAFLIVYKEAGGKYLAEFLKSFKMENVNMLKMNLTSNPTSLKLLVDESENAELPVERKYDEIKFDIWEKSVVVPFIRLYESLNDIATIATVMVKNVGKGQILAGTGDNGKTAKVDAISIRFDKPILLNVTEERKQNYLFYKTDSTTNAKLLANIGSQLVTENDWLLSSPYNISLSAQKSATVLFCCESNVETVSCTQMVKTNSSKFFVLIKSINIYMGNNNNTVVHKAYFDRGIVINSSMFNLLNN